MSVEKIYNGSDYIEVDVQDGHSETVKEIVRNWKNSSSDFYGDYKQVKSDSNQKIRMGDVVFEKRDGKYIVRKSSKSY
ncbi:MAG: hypothetical protein KBC44_02415 [Candidatus Pacebacteria bacterium]|nr:hypothetical protein [Candidatus Paceibacterota bacterium]MBP9839812.1 hypothetical protein [Candidatus Paceibacterota bacterium]MDQ5922761.1 hypothetical protein [Patescibacteria group bacterium]